MQRMVAVDTMTLIWGIRQAGAEEEIKRAKWLFQSLESDDAQIIVPSIAVSEYLTYSDESTHVDIINELNTRFFIPPFDVRCASLAARLFGIGKKLRKGGTPGARPVLRADSMIISTAKMHGAAMLYTDDVDCGKLASKIMEVSPLPKIPPDLFS